MIDLALVYEAIAYQQPRCQVCSMTMGICLAPLAIAPARKYDPVNIEISLTAFFDEDNP
jgi:hypothetical protein